MLVLLSVIEHFEGSEPHVTRRHTDQHRPGFHLLTIHRVIAPDETERLRGGNSESLHRRATQILTDRRTQHRSSVSIPGERRHPRPLEMEIPPLTLFVFRLSEKDCASIAELRDIYPELMAGIQHRERLHA